MRKTRQTRIALVAGLALAAFAVILAAGGPAYSDERQITSATAADAQAPATTVEIDAESVQTGEETEKESALQIDSEGYEWCASRTTANRYLWSHRPS